MKYSILFVIMLVAANRAGAAEPLPGLRYAPEGDAIVVRNGTNWNNRPLYCNRRYTFITAGEMPSLSGPMGTLYVGIGRGGTRVLLQQFAERVMRYRPGRMEWEMTDPRFPGMKVRLTGTTLADASGFTAQLKVDGAQAGDSAAWCVFPPSGKSTRQADGFQFDHARGRFSAPVSQWEQFAFDDREDLRKATPSADGNGLVAWIPLVDGQSPCMAMVSDENDENFKRAIELRTVEDPARAFAEGVARVEALGRQVVVDTPDSYFNAGVGASCAAMYGLFVEPAFVHGGNKWRIVFPGWRVMDGATAYGWHNLVAMAAKHHGDQMVMKPNGNVSKAQNEWGCMPTRNSRYYGEGYLGSAGIYHMQTQFFDQCIRDWRATGDLAFEKQLLPWLEAHLRHSQECFDPDGDGLYESYLNSWPSDSQWYNGGGSVEESAYVYYQRRAAAEMRRHLGDKDAAAHHDAVADKIQAAMDRVLWLKDKGQYAAYIEQGGHKRLHDDAWVYSEHLPIEAGLATPQQAWQAMYYTDWAMEHYRLPYGGEMRQTSNWVPGQWSVRELFHGDNFAMALGYFLAGQGDEGWELLRGPMLESMYGDDKPKAGYSNEHNQYGSKNFLSPGGLSQPNCSIDFNDITSMFCRAVVEGLFGYRPDYPNGVVRLAPSLPSAWDHASIKTPDFALAYRQESGADCYTLSVTKPAKMSLRLPVRAERVKSVRVNGKSVKFRIEAWAGCGMLLLELSETDKAEVVITLGARCPQVPAILLEKKVGEAIPVANAIDPQGCLGGKAKPGYHMAFARVERGNVPYLQVYKIHITDPVAEKRQTEQNLRQAPADATWTTIPLGDLFNGDVRTIFQQKYLSPRPETISCRIGYDGWRAWTFRYWGISTPQIRLNGVTDSMSSVYEAIDPSIANPTNAVTLEAWINPDAQPDRGGRIIDRLTPGTFDGYLLDTHAGNSLRLVTANGSLEARRLILLPGKMVHVAGVYDSVARVMKLYVDGKEIATKEDGSFPPIKPIARPVRIGGMDGSEESRFFGEIHRVAVHPRALSEAEIAARAKGEAPTAGAADLNLKDSTAGLKRIDVPIVVPVGDTLNTPQGVPFIRPVAKKNIAFTSLWDNWPKSVTIPVNKSGDAIWLLVCGSTNPMQGRIANAVIKFRYVDGQEETLELTPPWNFWSLCRFGRTDYDRKKDRFALPKEPPSQVQLGVNCRAMVYGWKLRTGVALKDVTLETLSQEVVIGLMGVSVMNPK